MFTRHNNFLFKKFMCFFCKFALVNTYEWSIYFTFKTVVYHLMGEQTGSIEGSLFQIRKNLQCI